MKPLLALLAALAGMAVAGGGCTQQPAESPAPAPPIEQEQPQSTADEPAAIHYSEGIADGAPTANGLTVPRGFRVNLFAEGLTQPRRLLVVPGSTAANYKILVAESAAHRISILSDSGSGVAEHKSTFIENLQRPYGMAFGDGWFYVGNADSIVRFPYQPGQTSINGKAEELLKVSPNGHWTRNLLFSRDRKKLYIAYGSSCNTCEEKDSHRAAISTINPDGSDYQIYASGLRNPVGMALRPGTDELWAVVNERDRLGDDIPPDYATRVEKDAFYGWPYAYTDIDGKIHADPNFGEKNPEKVHSTTKPTVPVQAHSAVLGIAFYPLQSGQKYFPSEYQGDAFLAYHGSWNRSERTGYKIARINFQNGRPVSVSDFVIGFLTPNGKVTGRPVDVTVAPDGSILFSDDKAGKIWRVVYVG